MLCPEVWNLRPKNNSIVIKSGVYSHKNKKYVDNVIRHHPFNQIISLVLPNNNSIPEAIVDLIKDSDHYCVENFDLKALIDRQFIEGFAKRGKFTALSYNPRNDVDDCYAVTPDGKLILSIHKELYQTLGIEGQKSTINNFKFGNKIMKIVTKVAKREGATSTDVLKSNIQVLYDIFQYNVPCYLFDRLSDEIFFTIPLLVDTIKKNLSSNSLSMGEFLSQVNVAVSLSEVIASPFLRKLNFEDMPKMMRHLFYSNLKKMRGLTYLNLCSLSGGWKTCDMEPFVLNGIVDMKNLQTLVLNYDCTDNILKAIKTACPRLQNLDISSSKSISNSSVKYLLELQNLKNIQLYRTSVTIDGYITLLIKLPLLQDVGRFDEIGRCLEYIEMTYEHCLDRPVLQLHTFASRFVITKHLQLLADMCPEIRTVSIFHNPLLSDLMALIPINKLAELKLLSCDFFGDQIRDVLQVKGCNITHLHFEHVDQIDMNALMYISQYCPDLKNFTIYNSELIESTSLYTRHLEIPPFMNLERLTVAANCKQQHMEFLLSNCLKIKFIHIGTMAPTTDAMFTKILMKNPLHYLEELRIIFSEGLTIATAYKLVDICQNLCILNELENWTLVKELELECFKMYISARNYDLSIKPLRQFKTDDEE